MTPWPQFPRYWPRTNIKWLERLHWWVGEMHDRIEHRLTELRHQYKTRT